MVNKAPERGAYTAVTLPSKKANENKAKTLYVCMKVSVSAVIYIHMLAHLSTYLHMYVQTKIVTANK